MSSYSAEFEAGVKQIEEMGFPREAAVDALKYANNDIYKAMDYIFNPPIVAKPTSITTSLTEKISDFPDSADTNDNRCIVVGPNAVDADGDINADDDSSNYSNFQRAIEESMKSYNGNSGYTAVDSQDFLTRREDQDNGVFSTHESNTQSSFDAKSNNPNHSESLHPSATAKSIPPAPPTSPGIAAAPLSPPSPPPRRTPYEYNPPTYTNSDKKFGPATREHYEENKWGLVPTSQSNLTSQLVASEKSSTKFFEESPRFRKNDEFPLLIPNSDGVYIAPLLVILHKIPLARRALLNDFNDITPDYGFDNDWWKGEIINTKPLLSHEIAYSSKALLMLETERLVAFLEGSSRRPFASINNLTKRILFDSVPALRGDSSMNHPVGQFLVDLLQYSDKQPLLSTAFATVPTQSPVDSDASIAAPEYPPEKPFANFVIDVSAALENDTLYDLVDELIWGVTEPPSSYLSHISDVITITLKREDSRIGAGIEIPLTFYPDRYTKPLIPYMRKLFDLGKKSRNAISALTRKKFDMSAFRSRDTSKILSLTAKYLRGLESRKPEDEHIQTAFVNGQEVNLKFDLEGLSSAVSEIESASAEFDAKKQALLEETQYHQHLIKLQKALFKGNDDDKETLKVVFGGIPNHFNDKGDSNSSSESSTPVMDESAAVTAAAAGLSLNPPPLRTYRLSGVIMSPTEYFFCVKTRPHSDEIPDLIMADEDEDEDLEDMDDLDHSHNTSDHNPFRQSNANSTDSTHEDLMLMDDSGAESAASTAAVSSDSTQTAVSLSQNDYEWYHVYDTSSTPQSNLLGVPTVARIGIPEMLDIVKRGSTRSDAVGTVLIYATEDVAWACPTQKQNLPAGLANFLERDRRALMTQMQQHANRNSVANQDAAAKPEGGIATPSSISGGEESRDQFWTSARVSAGSPKNFGCESASSVTDHNLIDMHEDEHVEYLEGHEIMHEELSGPNSSTATLSSNNPFIKRASELDDKSQKN